ncbi:Pentatricopeptide repeat-containing protein [Vitis vinifera]|uniref:Pentatricopeptide repeat-containing protein n=1 Tax=Vitis vinifera TaxID=29760 RepID=A0A438KAX2_VITVI|nr:Pentatricopeptide repeat-containing protein [Vitis vinifera]
MKLTVTLGTALMDFYAKCGSVESSIEVFGKMPVKNVLSWTVLIQGLASNGQGKRALEYFYLMLEKNVEPNDVTFIGVLSACSHAAGLIEEAFQFIKNMPIQPNAVIWRTLLASCKVHKNVEIGEESLKQLIILEPTHSGDYILLSNIYASVGRWEDALKVRGEMKEKGIKKTPGCSLIELDGVIHEFFAEDNVHSQSEEIYNAIEDMMKQIKSAGYVPNTAEARLDAEEDDKESSVSHHSEKLAIAFGLIKSPPGTTIRITKNLRVCTDCHNATKLVSKVFNREIVVRDRTRFHHFKEGSCSCNDYW